MLMLGIREDIPYEDAIGIAEMAVQTGRAIPASKWVEHLIVQKENSALDALI